VAVAIDHLFEYGEEFKGDLEQLLSTISKEELGYASCSVRVQPLDASAYLGLFKGVVLKADGCISIAASGDKGKLLTIGERGHMIGDPGSAYWIANKALRMIYDNADGIEPTDYNLAAATKAANEHFQLSKPLDVLKPLYSDFSKLRITEFCDKLANLAQRNDPFCVYLFTEAGTKVAHLLKAVFLDAAKQEVSMKGTIEYGRIQLLGVGRVWMYYDIIRSGFVQTLQSKEFKDALPIPLQRLEIFVPLDEDTYAVALLAGKLSDDTFVRAFTDQAKNPHINLVAAEAFRIY